ncbi:MAG: FeoB-associated Cys-rich membrane protein [Firmicutes bacterium]|nr:FeoB-associated Cys-rich membrane protein [Bacillota bacterium]
MQSWIFVLVALVVIVALIVRKLILDFKSGKTSCSCGCKNCSANCKCK